jgi:peptidoglycan/LPS O-acetylase OafA/YrhL
MTRMPPANGIAYRPEIDGLRALAVLPVILFHAGFTTFSGGFVGVDIFFVISGYLITGILLSEMKEDTFSITGFYERRARRLLPALFVVVLATMPFAWLWLMPQDLIDFGESLAAVATFSSNILFWQESDYFASDASLKPLLHTWSLAVEEQFYLLFPLLLLFLTRLNERRLMPLLGAGLVVSLAIAWWATANKPVPAFYLLPARGWELLIGALLATHESLHGSDSTLRGSGWLAVGGFAAVTGSVFLFDETIPVPGPWMLIPTLGTAAVILGTRAPSRVRWLLSRRPLVTTGLISYSAYLWHQPLLAFAAYRWPLHAPSWLPLVLVLGTFPLAYLTWKYVENPWRNRQRFSRQTVFRCAASALAILLVTGLATHFSDGFHSRLSSSVEAVVAGTEQHERLRDDGGCNLNRDTRDLAGCIKGADVPPRIALIGDSHAASLTPSLEAMLRSRSASFVQYTKLACPFGIAADSTEAFRCDLFWENVLEDINRRHFTDVIVVSRWTYYLHDRGFDNGLGGVEFHDGKRYSVHGIPFDAAQPLRASALLEAYRQAIRALDHPDRQIHVVLPIPEQGWDVPMLLARMAGATGTVHLTDKSITPLPRALVNARHADVLGAFGEFASHPRIHLFDPVPHLCMLDGGTRCPASLEGELLYYDDDHLTVAGSNRILEPLLNRMTF